MKRTTPTRHFTPRATLAAIGSTVRHLRLFDIISQHLKIKQKTVKHTPMEKLQDAFITILSGAHGLCEVNTRVRPDRALQRAFGRTACAEQSVVQETLDRCTEENVRQMQHAFNIIFRHHSQAFRQDYTARLQLIDIDFTGLPCGAKAEAALKGYFSQAGKYIGRQLGRVIATHYEEVVADLLFPGNVQLTSGLRPLVEALEETLELNDSKRHRTVLRMDAGGGSLDAVNWCLERGYHLHGKDISSARAEAWAATVTHWFDDPEHPGRQLGWVNPLDTPDYVRPLRRLAIRWRKRNGHLAHALLISTLSARDVISLLDLPTQTISDPPRVVMAYAQLYDQRAGAVEIEIKEDKQGFGMSKRRKKRFAAQQMVMLLNALAHNLLVWVRRKLSEKVPQLARYGTLRMVRDLLHVSGIIELHHQTNEIKSITLNRAAPLAALFVKAWRDIHLPKHIQLILGEI